MHRRTYSPWRQLRNMHHITLGITHLPLGDGWYFDDLQGIVLHERLNQVERRCVLAHELVHAERRDVFCHGYGPDGPRQARRIELAADDVAARRLLRIEDLGDALMPDLDHAALARDLHVTEHLLRARLRLLHPAEESWLRAHTGRRHPSA